MSKLLKVWSNWHVTPEGARSEVYEVGKGGVVEIYVRDPYYVVKYKNNLHLSLSNINKVLEEEDVPNEETEDEEMYEEGY